MSCARVVDANSFFLHFWDGSRDLFATRLILVIIFAPIIVLVATRDTAALPRTLETIERVAQRFLSTRHPRLPRAGRGRGGLGWIAYDTLVLFPMLLGLPELTNTMLPLHVQGTRGVLRLVPRPHIGPRWPYIDPIVGQAGQQRAAASRPSGRPSGGRARSCVACLRTAPSARRMRACLGEG